jgi:hypothetical protein
MIAGLFTFTITHVYNALLLQRFEHYILCSLILEPMSQLRFS